MIIKCKMCGGDIEFMPGATYGTCEYCGSTSTIPKAENDVKVNLHNRANNYRRQCEFDKAVAAYEKILEQDDKDAEAHWGAVISRFGIEYVEDPATKKRIPTCHRVQLASILADPDYLAAVENAPDEESRNIYKEEAQRIAAIQKEILSISENEQPYDVFICYKETDAKGQRTKDSALAQDIYYQLTNAGFKVFFSRITLEKKLGQQYEPYIFAALNSAKVMLVVGTRAEHFNAVWVKNEWSRYLSLMKQDRSRLLIPCYRDMDAYELPEELSMLQSQDMSKIGFIQDVLHGIRKVITKEEKKEPVMKVVTQQTAANTGAGIAPLLKRAYMFLEDGSWTEANNYCEKVLDQDPENAKAYFGKLMAKLRVRKESGMNAIRTAVRNDSDYQKAVRFADAAQKKIYEGYADAIDAGIEYDRKESIYQQGMREKSAAADEEGFARAEHTFALVCDHKDAATQAKQCRELAKQATERAETKRKDDIYNNAVKNLGSDNISTVESAIHNFESIIDWKDSKKKIEECRKKIEELNRKAEAERRAAEAAAKKKKKITIIICLIIAAVIVIAVLFVTVIQPAMKYSAAAQLVKDGQYDAATEAFMAMGDYKDAATQALAAQYAEGEALLASGDYDGATQAFNDAGSYSDAATQALAAQYAEGEALLASGDYDGATQAFNDAGSYSDAATQAQEAKYQKATTLKASGNYDGAYAIYSTLTGYKDVDSIIETDENISAAAHAAYIAQFDVGNTVTMGNYGGETIEWLVLAEDGDNRVMITVKGQDAVCFNKSSSDGNEWESSYIRTWLNDTFYNAAFSKEEKAMITAGPTNDNVWLLSVDEAKQYFASDEDRICYATQTAKDNGAYTNASGACWWWLRSPGSDSYGAADVGKYGLVYSSGDYVSSTYDCVRPAVVVRLS